MAVCPVLHSRTQAMTTGYPRQRHRQARVRTVPARHGTPLNTRVAVYAAQRSCTQLGTATMQALLAISASHRAAAQGSAIRPAPSPLTRFMAARTRLAADPARLACGIAFPSSPMLHVGQRPLLRTGPSSARDPPMAHGQHHEPRQPMRKRQPHRGCRGQPSGTVAAAR